jgi:hypothetical protein
VLTPLSLLSVNAVGEVNVPGDFAGRINSVPPEFTRDITIPIVPVEIYSLHITASKSETISF